MNKLKAILSVLVFGALLGGSIQAALLRVKNNSKQEITVRFEGGTSVVPFVETCPLVVIMSYSRFSLLRSLVSCGILDSSIISPYHCHASPAQSCTIF